MTSLVVTAIDRKGLSLDERAVLAQLADSLVSHLSAELDGTRPRPVVLDTCERFELYHGERDAMADRFRQDLGAARLTVQTSHGPEALRHLFRVATGLDSRLIGETHILGQVRAAHAAARKSGPVEQVVDDALTYAVRCSRHVRRRVRFSPFRSDWAGLTLEQLRASVERIETTAITVIGTGMLGQDLLVHLHQAGARTLTVVGRNGTRLSRLANACEARPVLLEDFLQAPGPARAIISAVSTVVPILTSSCVDRSGATLLIDLGASPNIDPALVSTPTRTILRLEDLSASACTTDASHQAGVFALQLVDQEVRRFLALRQSRASTGLQPGQAAA